MGEDWGGWNRHIKTRKVVKAHSVGNITSDKSSGPTTDKLAPTPIIPEIPFYNDSE
jgi:hypothetical protein